MCKGLKGNDPHVYLTWYGRQKPLLYICAKFLGMFLRPKLTTILKLSLEQSVVPTCLKEFTIVPVPKYNWYNLPERLSPVALTSLFVKCFNRTTSAPLYLTTWTHYKLLICKTDLETMAMSVWMLVSMCKLVCVYVGGHVCLVFNKGFCMWLRITCYCGWYDFHTWF